MVLWSGIVVEFVEVKNVNTVSVTKFRNSLSDLLGCFCSGFWWMVTVEYDKWLISVLNSVCYMQWTVSAMCGVWCLLSGMNGIYSSVNGISAMCGACWLLGVVNAAGWLGWCAIVYRKQRYVWKCAASTIAVCVLLLLELGDFPPIWWTLDAHALWHAGTAPLPLLWYW